MKRAHSVLARTIHILIGHSHSGLSRHHRMRRHAVGCGVGVVLMLTGSTIAAHAKEINSSIIIINHITVDAFGYFLHGIGCIPLISNIEPLYKLWKDA